MNTVNNKNKGQTCWGGLSRGGGMAFLSQPLGGAEEEQGSFKVDLYLTSATILLQLGILYMERHIFELLAIYQLFSQLIVWSLKHQKKL